MRFSAMYKEWPNVSLKAALCIISISPVINKQTNTSTYYMTQYNTRCYFHVCSKEAINKADIQQINAVDQ